MTSIDLEKYLQSVAGELPTRRDKIGYKIISANWCNSLTKTAACIIVVS
jgi:hypothetical protein